MLNFAFNYYSNEINRINKISDIRDKFQTKFDLHRFFHKSYIKYLIVELRQLVYCELNLQQTKNVFECIKFRKEILIFTLKCYSNKINRFDKISNIKQF